MPDVPRVATYAMGKNTHHIIVIPSLGLVIVRVGHDGWTNHGGKLASFLQPMSTRRTDQPTRGRPAAAARVPECAARRDHGAGP
jgi:hypothetical protein